MDVEHDFFFIAVAFFLFNLQEEYFRKFLKDENIN